MGYLIQFSGQAMHWKRKKFGILSCLVYSVRLIDCYMGLITSENENETIPSWISLHKDLFTYTFTLTSRMPPVYKT